MTSYGIEGTSFNDYLKEYYTNNHKLKDYYEYAGANKSVKELIYTIKENKMITYKNDKIEIQHAINEANILTIAIGMDELTNKKINSITLHEYKEDFEELLSMIKMLNQNKIIVLGIYKSSNNDYLSIEKANAIIRDIALSNNFIYLDINNLLNDEKFYLTKESHYINYQGHNVIYQELKKII